MSLMNGGLVRQFLLHLAERSRIREVAIEGDRRLAVARFRRLANVNLNGFEHQGLWRCGT